MSQPYVPFGLNPIGGVAFDATEAKDFSWIFKDPNSTHKQSAYYIEYKENVPAATVNTTGWINSDVSSITWLANKFMNGRNYAWRVKVKDNQPKVNLFPTNLLALGDSDISKTGWTQGNSTQQAVYMDGAKFAYSGGYSYKIGNTVADVYTSLYYDLSLADISVGSKLCFSAYIDAPVVFPTNRGCYLEVEQFDSVGTSLNMQQSTRINSTTNWQRSSVVSTVLTGATKIRLKMVCYGGLNTANQYGWFDAPQIEIGDTPTSFRLPTAYNIESDFSDWVLFKTSRKPSCAIVYPVNDYDIVDTDIPTIQHTFSDEEGKPQVNYQYTLYVERNLLSNNQATIETDLTGFIKLAGIVNNGSGITISRDTSFKYQGVASLYVETSGTHVNEGVYLPILTNRQGSYIGQCRITGSGTVDIWTRINYTDNTTDDAVRKNITLDKTWQLAFTNIAVSNSQKTVQNVEFHIRTYPQQIAKFWVDALMLENSSIMHQFTLPDDDANLVWTSDIFEDTDNLSVIPKGKLQNSSIYKIVVTVTDSEGLTATSAQRKFFTNWSSTQRNVPSFQIFSKDKNSAMDLNWSSVQSKKGNYFGSGMRFKTAKINNGIEVSQVGEKVYWDIEIPQIFTICNWCTFNAVNNKTILYLYQDSKNYLRFYYDTMGSRFIIEKSVDGNVRMIGSPVVTLTGAFFYCIKQGFNGITAYTGCNGNALVKWGDI